MQGNENQFKTFSEKSKLLFIPGNDNETGRRTNFYDEDAGPQPQQKVSEGFHLDTRKMLIGVAIVIGIAFSWVGSTQFAQSSYSPDFNAPFFVSWFTTSWVLVVFPVYFLRALLRGKKITQFYRESERVFGSQGLHLSSLLKYVGPFCLLWVIANYSYVRALGVLRAADVSALFSSCNAFVYLFSLIWLQERLGIVQISAVALCIGGIVMMAYAEGFAGPNVVGVILSVTAAIGAALYKVWFKRIVGDATLGQVSLFLSCLSLLSTVLLWPLIVIFHYTRWEEFKWEDIPWKYLCGNAVLGMIFNFLINFGIAFTYPLFISLGTVLGIPINAVTDYLFRGAAFGSYKIVAAFSIVIGFLFMLLPKEFEETLQETFCCRKRERILN